MSPHIFKKRQRYPTIDFRGKWYTFGVFIVELEHQIFLDFL